MTVVDFNVGGNTIAALFLSVLPLLVVAVGIVSVRMGHMTAAGRFSRRLHHAPLIIVLLAYFAVVYRQFFYDQFYWLVVHESGDWQFEYYLPSRTKTIDPATISDIRAFSGDLWTYRDVRIVIETESGARYVSTQIGRHDRDRFLALLDALRGGRVAP